MSGRSSEKAQKRSRRNGLASVSGDWQGFVDITLTDVDKEQVKEYAMSDEFDLGEQLELLVAAGYKVSISPQNRGESVVASLTGRSPECINLGYSLSGFGPGCAAALAVVCFKHWVLCGGGSWKDQSENPERQLTLWG